MAGLSLTPVELAAITGVDSALCHIQLFRRMSICKARSSANTFTTTKKEKKTLNMIGPAWITCQPLPSQPKEQTSVAHTIAHSLLLLILSF